MIYTCSKHCSNLRFHRNKSIADEELKKHKKLILDKKKTI